MIRFSFISRFPAFIRAAIALFKFTIVAADKKFITILVVAINVIRGWLPAKVTFSNMFKFFFCIFYIVYFSSD